MREWPVKLRELFPVASDRIPERPWWRYDGGPWASRVGDGSPITCRRDRQAEHAVLRDRAVPLAHPGFRPGQLWALEFPGDRFYCGLLEAGVPVPSVLVVGATSRYVFPWIFAGHVLDLDDFNHLFRGISPRDRVVEPPPIAYLIADPGCPHLAPWAPSEASDG